MAVWSRTDITATFWFLNALCIILVAIRVYVRVTTVYRPWRELLVVLALLMQIFYCVTQIYSYYRFHVWDMLIPGSGETGEITRDSWVWNWKLLFINHIVTGVGIISYQAVLMLMYMDLCSRHVFPKIWMLMVVNWILIAGFAGVVVIYTCLGSCPGHKLSLFWEGDAMVCSNMPYLMVRNAFGDLTELLLYIIPMFVVYQLPNLSTLQKVSIVAMFSVGFVNVVLFILNTAIWPEDYNGIRRAVPASTVWSRRPEAVGLVRFSRGLVIPTGLMVVCMPQLRVLGRWKLARRVAASITRSVGVGTRSGTISNTVAHAQPAGEQSEAAVQANLDEAPVVQRPTIVNVEDEEKGIEVLEVAGLFVSWR